MADVKYTNSSWIKMGNSIAQVSGIFTGSGVTDKLIKVTENLEKAEENINTYDEDGIISFTHTDNKNKYKTIKEKLQVLYDFTKNVDDVLCKEIDDPFYKKMDAYVEKMRDLNITSYSTANSLGIRETRTAYAMGTKGTYDVTKEKITLEDIMKGDNHVGKMMQAEWKMYEEKMKTSDISYNQYLDAKLNSGAFAYESIRDKQLNLETIVTVGITIVNLGLYVVCPLAGAAMSAFVGAYTVSRGIDGKAAFSGRELSPEEQRNQILAGGLEASLGMFSFYKLSKFVSPADELLKYSKAYEAAKMKDLHKLDGEKASGAEKIMSNADAEKYAFDATKGANNSDSIVLGKFDGGGPTAYTTKAKEVGAQYFELDNWGELSKMYSDKEIWKINEKFLDIQIGSGRDIYFSHNPLDFIGDGSFYSQEIAYLQNHGFRFEKIGDLWHVIR